MREEQLREFIGGSLAKVVLACTGAAYSFPFQAQALSCKEYSLDLPIVGHQLVCTEGTQIVSYILMELNSFLTASATLFPNQPRNESIKMIISGNNEILNLVDSKLAAILSRVEGRGSAVITPPVVMNYSGGNKLAINCSESIMLQCQCRDFAFRFISTLQMV
jgi:hypothetical protein